ncbi:MAG: molybdenum cofactor biosynthesis protein MoaE [Planctomycetes bacterium]|nr:molybdenum cofactor biosynthesis protein MoaE [Planctomycetota bacterium]
MIELVDGPIDAARVLAAVRSGSCGAIVTFDGTVRDHHEGRRVLLLEYHAYRPMAHEMLSEIARDAARRWPDVRLAIVHRLGRLEIGETSVLVAAAAPHRAQAFEAARHAIERIKVDVPIWKKEYYDGGVIWVGDQTGEQAPTPRGSGT